MLRAKLLQLLREKPRTLEELARLTGHPVPTVKWHLIGLPVRLDGPLLFLVDEVDKTRTHDGIVNLQPAPALKFTFSCASSIENPPKEEIERICSVCDKVEEEAAECPLRHHGFCKVDNHDGGKLVNRDALNKTDLTLINSKTEQSHHILSHQQSDQKARKLKRNKQKRDRGLQLEVYNPDHGWLTKPLTIADYGHSIENNPTPAPHTATSIFR